MHRFTCTALLVALAAPLLFNLRSHAAITIPYSAFPEKEDVKKVKKVLEKYTLTHTTSAKRFKSTSRTFNFLLDHMPLTTAIMRELGLEKYEITRRDDGTMMSDDKDGVVGTFEPVFVSDKRRILYGDGMFSAGLLGDIRGESVVVIDYVEDDSEVKCETAVFVRVHGFLAPFVRLASPIIRGMVSRKSASMLTASMTLSEQLTTDPGRVYERICNSEQITPDDLRAFRKEFVREKALVN